MKTLHFFPVLLLLIATSCSSVQVYTDYDKKVDFASLKSYAFYKPGIDNASASDLDKKRILRSIDEVMLVKGFVKSETPDLLISFNTNSEQNVNINQSNFGWGWGFDPFWGGNSSVWTSTDSILTLNFLDAKSKELIWQGDGVGYLTKDPEQKDENIKGFIIRILTQYPPVKK